mgnify:CR=1 FL=1
MEFCKELNKKIHHAKIQKHPVDEVQISHATWYRLASNHIGFASTEKNRGSNLCLRMVRLYQINSELIR